MSTVGPDVTAMRMILVWRKAVISGPGGGAKAEKQRMNNLLARLGIDVVSIF